MSFISPPCKTAPHPCPQPTRCLTSQADAKGSWCRMFSPRICTSIWGAKPVWRHALSPHARAHGEQEAQMPTPRRVVSLSPNVSMILFALDADAAVVGRTQECLAAIQQYLTVWRIPEHAVAQRLQHWQALPVVGTWPLADHESIKALQPESILTSGSGPFGVHDAQTFGVEAEALFHFDTRTLHDLDQHIQQ